MLNLLLKRYGVDAGILEWDAKAGTFSGFAAAEVRACAGHVQSHPSVPYYDTAAEKDSVALAILLVCLGWDVPDPLKPSLDAWLSGFTQLPEGSVP